MNGKNDNYCTFYLVRHGETEANVKRLNQGDFDAPLTEKGMGQVKIKAEEFKDVAFDAVFASDTGRAQATAEILKLDRKLATQTSHFLRERSFGSYEGRSAEEIIRLRSEVAHLSSEEMWNHRLAGVVESNEEVSVRFIRQLREIAVAYPGKTVLVVTHGGTLRTFLVKVGYGTEKDFPSGSLGNAAHVKVRCDGIDFFVDEVSGKLL